MTTHTLKTWPQPFEGLLSGQKTHEVRPHDREFKVGDELVLREWEPAHLGFCSWDDDACLRCGRHGDAPLPGRYTGREVIREITYVTEGGSWGLPLAICVLSIRPKT